ncbi:hypothetical protein CLOP_g5557 [Closterium sp. NIES-67]|nr:hypothetical protein CLOP_g5557 [Closterium sp. NIES-67]
MPSALVTWLEEHGARIYGCEIRQCLAKTSPSVASVPSKSSESILVTTDSRVGDVRASDRAAIVGEDSQACSSDATTGDSATTEGEAAERGARTGDHAPSSAGFGVFLSRLDKDERKCTVDEDTLLLSVPLSLLLSAPTALQDPLYGSTLRRLHAQGLLDHRMLVILLLLLHRCHQKDRSFWAPYLACLPQSFDSPLWFDQATLEELTGTPLHAAASAQRANLRRVYEEQVEPLFAAVVGEAEDGRSGDASTSISLYDFLWANSIFWSRALSLPLTPCRSAYADVAGAGNADDATVAADADADTADAGDAGDAGDAVRDATPASSASRCLEAIVPGIDFCNHSMLPCARWEVFTANQLTRFSGKSGNGGEGDGMGDGGVAGSASVAQPLDPMTHSDAVCLLQVLPPVGSNEVTISYGDKGNEELLFLYGFAIRNNPHERLMLNYPAAQLQDDPCADTKLQLLAIQDLSLQWIIPRCPKNPKILQGQQEDQEQQQQEPQQQQHEAQEQQQQEPQQQQHEAQEQEQQKGQAQCKEEGLQEKQQQQEKEGGHEPGDLFPPGMMAALRVLSLTELQVVAATTTLMECKAAAGEAPLNPADAEEAVREAGGGDAQPLLLLQQLLQQRLDNMLQTGSSEDDAAWLHAHARTGVLDDKSMRHKALCVIYRLGQKLLGQELLTSARTCTL